MDVPARSLCQPIADQYGLVGGIVVHDEVDVEVGGDVGLDMVEELAELGRAMLGIAASYDGSGGYVEGAEQRRGAVPLVVVGAALDLSGAHRQQGLAAVECLNLAFFVDAEDEGTVRRRHVEPDDVAHLLHEQRIGGEFERLGAVRLEAERLPDAMDGRRGVTRDRSQGTQRPNGQGERDRPVKAGRNGAIRSDKALGQQVPSRGQRLDHNAEFYKNGLRPIRERLFLKDDRSWHPLPASDLFRASKVHSR